MEWLAVLLLSYLIGSFPTAYVVTKLLTGKDVRKYGSKNVGGLNTYRLVKKEKGKVMGILAGSFVALIDASKAIISYLIASIYTPSVAFLAPAVAIFGHNYPVWLRFRGGRGVAALLGFFLFTMPALFFLFLFLQGTIYAFTRRFAVGAIFALLFAIPVHHIIFTSSTYLPQVFAEFPVWLRYREKYELWRTGKLGVNM